MWDLFGQALEDFLEGRSCTPFYWLRSDGALQPESISHYFAELSAWSPQDRWALDNIAGRVLDVGCGAGKHSLELQRRRVPVVAIELSRRAAAVSVKRGVAAVRLMSAFDLQFPADSFDCALLLTNNLSIGGTPSGVQRILEQLSDVITFSGRIVATNLDVTRTTDDMSLTYHQANRREGKLPGAIRMRSCYGGQIGEWLDWLFMSPDELTAIANLAGWRATKQATFPSAYCVVLERLGSGRKS